jgi:hypothetical protein
MVWLSSPGFRPALVAEVPFSSLSRHHWRRAARVSIALLALAGSAVGLYAAESEIFTGAAAASGRYKRSQSLVDGYRMSSVWDTTSLFCSSKTKRWSTVFFSNSAR